MVEGLVPYNRHAALGQASHRIRPCPKNKLAIVSSPAGKDTLLTDCEITLEHNKSCLLADTLLEALVPAEIRLLDVDAQKPEETSLHELSAVLIWYS